MINWIKLISSLSMVFVFYIFGYTNPVKDAESIFDLMGGEEIIKLTIDIDLDSVIAQRRKDETLATSVSFTDKEGQPYTLDVKLAMRGRFRRGHCSVPPLKLDFKKKDLEDNGLARFDDYKLVTHCVSDMKSAKELIIREYLAYKMYNELTKYSYRVQLVQITYRSPNTGKEDEQWGFLIEDTSELSARLGLEKLDYMALSKDSIQTQSLKVVSVFQKMIGNPDWGIDPTKNVKYFRKEGKIILVAYDFDFSLFVDAPYAEATRKVSDANLAPVPDQYTNLHPEVFGNSISGTISYFQSKRKELVTIIKECKVLPGRIRSEMVGTLAIFYREILEL